MKTIYLCGPTVYDDIHIGNLRTIVTMDFYIRTLVELDIEYFYIQNITDIDDKIIAKAIESNKTEKFISNKYTNAYLKILKIMNVIMPSKIPLVTNYIDIIISDIEKMISNNFAYIRDGSVYFDTAKFKNYGSMSNKKIQDLKFDNDKLHNKKNYADFVVWKKTNLGITWKSPWSNGRPGWHTECAVLINKLNSGKILDLHAGGIDLKFPHHENENIQYLALTSNQIAKEWLHIGQLMFNSIKMSKSKGQIIKATDFIADFGSNVARNLFFASNPKGPLSYNNTLLNNSKNEVKKYYDVAKKINIYLFENKNKFKNQKIVFQDFANAILNFDFSTARHLIMDEVKMFNKKNNLLSALKIYSGFQIIGFDFKLPKITKNSILLFYKWQDLVLNSQYQEADKLRKKLINKRLI